MSAKSVGATRRSKTMSGGQALSRRRPFAHQIANALRDRIIRGELPPGERVVERTLCDMLQVSRTPLREALKLLELEGLIEISQNKGARIMSFTAEEATSLFDVIASLESLAAEILAQRHNAAALAELDDMHTRMIAHYQRQEKEPYFALNSAIHDRIVSLSGNPILITTHASLMTRARRGRYMAIIDPARWEESVGEHETLMKALRARDAEAARRVWRQHLLRTGETVRAVLAAAEPATTDALKGQNSTTAG